jgi:hypothetical protein
MGLYERLLVEREEEERHWGRSSEGSEGLGLPRESGISPRITRSRLMRFRGRCRQRLRAAGSFDEVGGGDLPDHASRASGGPGLHVLFDARWSYRRRHSSSLGLAVGRGIPLDWLE